jgi:hypothetical protein
LAAIAYYYTQFKDMNLLIILSTVLESATHVLNI